MEMAADDQTDADFFDKLVDDEDDPSPAPAPAPAKHDQEQVAEAALVRGVSSLSLADDDPESSAAPEVAAPPPTAEAPPEGGSPDSGKGGVHTAVKQVQWASFGGGGDDGVDPFGDLSGGADEEGFFGSMAGNQSLESSVVGSVGASAHGFFSGSQSLATEVTDQDFFGGSSNQNTDVQQQLEQSGSGTVDSTDPKYLESIYPGWKYDEATQQWYQVDSFDTSGSAAQVDNSGENVQQQQFGVSYLQNSAQAALETIAEEGTTMGSVSTWGQLGASEYPPNMLFYAEYPGWYFDTNTQQWQSLELYQQATVQDGTASVPQDGANHGVVASSGGTNYNIKQTEDLAVHNQVAQHHSFTNSYSNQSQWQTDAFGNTMQPESVTDSLAGSFYGSDQLANAESFSSSTNHQVGFNTAETTTSHYGGNKIELSSLQSGYNAIDGQQASYKGFEPSSGHQAGYKGSEPSTGHHHGGYMGFEPAANHLGGYKVFDPSIVHQAGYNGSETSTGHDASFKGFGPSSGQHSGYRGSQPSTGHQSNHIGFETSSNQGYGDVTGVVDAQAFVPMESMYHSQKRAHASPQVHLSNSYLGTENSMNFSHQQFLGANASHMQFGHSLHEERSSAGRPPHALVAFGFGGKLIVMKETSSMATNFNSGNQGNSSGTVSVLNLSEVVASKADASSITNGSALSYFHALCHQPVPGPLVGGSAASKDVNKCLPPTFLSPPLPPPPPFPPTSRLPPFSRANRLLPHHALLRARHAAPQLPPLPSPARNPPPAVFPRPYKRIPLVSPQSTPTRAEHRPSSGKKLPVKGPLPSFSGNTNTFPALALTSPTTPLISSATGTPAPSIGQGLECSKIFIWDPRVLGSLPHPYGVSTAMHGLINHRHLKAWKARREEHPAMFDASPPAPCLLALL